MKIFALIFSCLVLVLCMAAGPQDVLPTRVIVQSVEIRDAKLLSCVALKGSKSRGFFTTKDYQAQLTRNFYSRAGRRIYVRDAIIRSLPPAPPFSTEEHSFILVEGNTSVVSCAEYNLADFEGSRFKIKAEFRSWLQRDQTLPPEIVRLSIENQYYDRPLFNDEPIQSNYCDINLESRQVRC